MFEKLGTLIVNRKKFIFSLFIALILAAGAIGSSVFGKLDSGGYSDPKSDSAKVFEYLTDVFKVKDLFTSTFKSNLNKYYIESTSVGIGY